MPAYRMMIFWFRFAGFLHAVAEQGTCRVKDHMALARQGIEELWEQAAACFVAMRKMQVLSNNKHRG